MQVTESLLPTEKSKLSETLFQIGMYWRVCWGFLRLIIASLLLHRVGTPVSEVFSGIARGEHTEDPTDMFLNFFSSLLDHFPYSISYFLVFYLIFWGIIDIVLSISLLKHKLWAFPVTLYLIAVFVVYEIYRFFHTHSLLLLWIILVDIVLMILIRNEYKKLKSRLAT